MEAILADKTVSVTELQQNFAAIISEVGNDAVAILSHNKPEAYLLPAAYYEQLLDRLEDLEDIKLVKERGDGPFVKVDLNDI